MRNKKTVKVVVKMFANPLMKAKEKLRVFPYKKAELMKEFNRQLSFGSVEEAEKVREAISKLEAEGEALRSEIEKLEKGGLSRDRRE